MTTPEEIRDALRSVIDPELGINVVDLGLVYGVDVRGHGVIRITMTMTTAACPLGESLGEQAEATIRRTLQGVESVSVELVWDPPWQPSMMSDTARRQLGWAE
jgi:metal-sulfur cluster biosynthetic enzyme